MADELLNSLEIDVIGEIMNISMGSGATAASSLLDSKVLITTPVVEIVKIEDFNFEQLEPAMAVEIEYVEGITGSNIMILKESDVRKILSKMMMTEIADDYEIDEIGQSAICEMMNQMMGSSATVLSSFLERTINISTPVVVGIDDVESFKQKYFEGHENIITISFDLTVGDELKTQFMSVMGLELARELIEMQLPKESQEEPQQEQQAPPQQEMPPQQMPQQEMPPYGPQQMPPQQMPPQQMPPYGPQQMPPQQMPPQQMPPQQMPPYGPQQMPPQQMPYYGQPYYGQPMYGQPYEQQSVLVKNYDYAHFDGGNAVHGTSGNIELIMEVPVIVTVELGKAKKKIKEILEFSVGSVVELDKAAGSQVDIIVNGQLIAKGDVVVVDDNYSVRITEVLKTRDLVNNLV